MTKETIKARGMMFMKIKNLLAGILILLSIQSVAHNPAVARLQFDVIGHDVYLKAYLQKKMLASALKIEGECAPQDMINICTDIYFQQQIQCALGSQALELKKAGTYIEKDYIVIDYKITIDEKKDHFRITSSYMLNYFDHAAIEVFVSHDGERSQKYKMDRTKKELFFTL